MGYKDNEQQREGEYGVPPWVPLPVGVAEAHAMVEGGPTLRTLRTRGDSRGVLRQAVSPVFPWVPTSQFPDRGQPVFCFLPHLALPTAEQDLSTHTLHFGDAACAG